MTCESGWGRRDDNIRDRSYRQGGKEHKKRPRKRERVRLFRVKKSRKEKSMQQDLQQLGKVRAKVAAFNVDPLKYADFQKSIIFDAIDGCLYLC